MLTKVKFNRIALAVALSLGITSSAFAQETTSGIRGQITTPTGAPASDVSVVVTHIPSGTVKTVATNADGAYRLRGLRVGGPYRIEFDSDEFRDQSFDEVYLQLAEVERISAQLEDPDVERISVTASRPAFTSAGSSSYFGEFAIQNQAGTSRDLKDVLRSNPLVTISNGDDRAMSIGGANPKFNSITIDGIAQNDNFGLNGNGYPTQRSPLPLDALEQVTVDVAPFNTRVSGFSGGVVNAVLKSGTNDFSGSVFYENYNSDNAGDFLNGDGEATLVEYDETTKGMSLSGPIIEDKLFFAVTYEDYSAPISAFVGPAESGAPVQLDVTQDEINEVMRIANERYGISNEMFGSWNAQPVENNTKTIVKLDWNINEEHRAALTYQQSEGNKTRNVTGPDESSELSMSSNWYDNYEILENVSAFLYSDWTPDFSTEISVTYQDKDNRQTSYGNYADITVRGLESGGEIRFGADNYRHANRLDNQFTTYRFEGNYLTGDHSITFGADYSARANQNLFVQDSLGVATFNKIENFEAGIAESYVYHNATSNIAEDLYADFEQQTLALYAQDSWDVTYDLNILFGLRYERLTATGSPRYNAASESRTGMRNDYNMDGVDILLPRLGFNYTVSDDTTLRGGIGKYTGGQPDVWISNAFSNDGVTDAVFDKNNVEIGPGDLVGVPAEATTYVANAISRGNVNLNDPGYELPFDYRAQIGIDQLIDIPMLGDDYEFTAEYMYVDRQKATAWVDMSLQDWDIERMSKDGQRIIYNDDDQNFDIMLTNAEDGGRSKIFTLQLSKAYESGLSFDFAYSNQDVTESNNGSSSRAISNYAYSPALNLAVAGDRLGPGIYATEHALNLNLSYQKAFFGDYNTVVNVFFSRRSGTPVDYITRTTSSARSQVGPDLATDVNLFAYIPTANDDTVVYSDGGVAEVDADGNAQPTDEETLLANVQALGLQQFAGGYADKGTEQLPWVTTLDLSISQEFPVMAGIRGKVYFNIDNVLNLLDKNKGKIYETRYGNYTLYRLNGYDAEGRTMIGDIYNNSPQFDIEDSTWRMSMGVRFSF